MVVMVVVMMMVTSVSMLRVSERVKRGPIVRLGSLRKTKGSGRHVGCVGRLVERYISQDLSFIRI